MDEQVTSDSDDELNPLSEVLLYRVAQRFLARQFRRIADKGTKDEQGRLMLARCRASFSPNSTQVAPLTALGIYFDQTLFKRVSRSGFNTAQRSLSLSLSLSTNRERARGALFPRPDL